MRGLSFVDTHVLVYAEDRDAGSKHELARDLALDLWESRKGVISVQVLAELFVTVTRKLQRPLAADQARAIVEEYSTWSVVEGTAQRLLSGALLADRFQLSLWDGLIVQAALDAGCAVLWTEDLLHGQRFGDLLVRNPFDVAEGWHSSVHQ